MRNITRYYAIQFKLDPDDLHQEIEEKLLRKNTYSVQEGATYNTWLHHIIKNHCIDITRKKANRQKFYTFKPMLGGSTTPDYHSRQHIASIFWKVRKRWPRKRAINTRVLWMVMTGWKYEEMVKETGIHISTIKSMIHRIRKFIEDYR